MAENKLYVGNLAFAVTESQLADAFQEFGTVVRASIVTDRETGRSRGFGFVEMATSADANAAIDGLNGTELSGRQIQVNVARPREDRGGSAGGGGGRRSGGGFGERSGGGGGGFRRNDRW